MPSDWQKIPVCLPVRSASYNTWGLGYNFDTADTAKPHMAGCYIVDSHMAAVGSAGLLN